MAGLHRLLHHPQFLVSHPPVGRILALPASLALCRSLAGMDGDVDCPRPRHRTLAVGRALPRFLAVAAGHRFVRRRALAVPAIRRELQRKPTRRPSRNRFRSSRAETCHLRHSRSRAPSRLSGAHLRNAGLEYRNRAGGSLWVDRIRSRNRCAHDSLRRS